MAAGQALAVPQQEQTAQALLAAAVVAAVTMAAAQLAREATVALV
jgi:hypothetical protein